MRRGWKLAVPAVLFLAVFAVYSHTLGFGFVFDDHEQIVKNPWVKSIGASLQAFYSHSFGWGEGFVPISYRPMVYFTYAIEHAFSGLEPWGWHLVNILAHAVNSIILFFLIARLLPKGEGTPALNSALPPFAGALVFALHPAAAEPVSWAGCVPELFYTLLGLSILFIAAGDEKNNGAAAFIKFRIVPGALFFIALLFKETAVAIPVLALVYDVVKNGTAGLFTATGIKRYVPYAAAFAAYFVIRTLVMGQGIAPAYSLHGFLTGGLFALNSMVLFARYLATALWPTAVPMQMLDPVYSATEPRAVAAFAGIMIALLLLFLFSRKNRLGFLAIAILILPILPALYSPAVSRVPFADRYMYFPIAGLGLFAALFIGKALSARPGLGMAMLAATVLVTVPYAVYAHQRSLFWESDMTLWGAALKAQPGNYVAKQAIAKELLDAGNVAGALTLLERSLEDNLSGPHPEKSMELITRRALSNAYLKAGLLDKAQRNIEEYLRLAPEDPAANYNLGLINQQAGKCVDALEYYEKARLFAEKPGLKEEIRRKTDECTGAINAGDAVRQP